MKTKIIFLSILFTMAVALITNAQPGANDPTFNPGTGFNVSVDAIAIQNDGKILAGGSFTTFNEISRYRIARLNIDGTLDETFMPELGPNAALRAVAIQSDGKILIGGEFTSYNTIARNHIARLNSDGSLDYSFDVGAGANNTVNTIAIQNDGKIIIGGAFTSYNGTVWKHIVRLNNNGTLDLTFNPVSGPNLRVYTTAIQPDGKIIIGGTFTSYNGIVINKIARVFPNGSLDATFNVSVGANGTVYTTAIQSDGKILIGGDFTSYEGTSINRIARLNADGTIDLSFNPGTGLNNDVWSIVIQSDGKIIIGGVFDTFNGLAKSGIARLNVDGSLDASFITGTGIVGYVNATVIQIDGKILIAGNFTSYNGISRNGVARILTQPAGLESNKDKVMFKIFPNPTNGKTSIISNCDIKSIIVHNVIGEIICTIPSCNQQLANEIDLSGFMKGIYFVRFCRDKEVYVERIVLQ